jgi:hypothetical protein
MNKDRRNDISNAIDLLEEAKAKLEEAQSLIDSAASDERDYYDNMPESLQSADKGVAADAAATGLEEVRDTLNELDFDDMVQKLESARDD